MALMIIGRTRLYVAVYGFQRQQEQIGNAVVTGRDTGQKGRRDEQQEEVRLETQTISFRAEESNERLYYLFPTRRTGFGERYVAESRYVVRNHQIHPPGRTRSIPPPSISLARSRLNDWLSDVPRS